MHLYSLCLVLFVLGIYCVIVKRNIIKIIIGLIIAETAVNLFFVLVAFRYSGSPPLYERDGSVAAATMADPLPHAIVLTAIVIGLATTALLIAFAMRIYEKYGTYDITEIRELRG